MSANNRIRAWISRHWQPSKITQPKVDPDLSNLNAAQQFAEVIRFNLLSFEWWVSPNGRLREWLRLNGKVSSILLIPAVLVMPLVTLILWQLVLWIGWLLSITTKLILLPVVCFIAFVVVHVVVALLRTIVGK
jgi:hypothetical protein